MTMSWVENTIAIFSKLQINLNYYLKFYNFKNMAYKGSEKFGEVIHGGQHL